MKSVTLSHPSSLIRVCAQAARLTGALVLISSAAALAQFSGNIQGTVRDSGGAVIPNANVTVMSVDTGVVNQASTNQSGQYRVNSLAPGQYRIHVVAPGFQITEVVGSVTTSQDAGVDLTLAVESSSQSINVSTEIVGLDPEETRVQTTLDTQQVRDLPLQGRGTLNLVNTAPGVSGYTENTNNFAVEQTPAAAANGHYSGGNLFVLDGISITSNITTGTANISPNSDSIQEVSLQVNTFSIDFPAGSGLTTAITTKGGSNKFHGTGNFTYTDQTLRAHGYFQKGAIPKISNKDFSATFGGPLFKDHTFFFGSVEQLNNKTAATNQFSVEDPAFLAYAKANNPNSIGTALLNKFPLQNGSRTGVLVYATPDFLTTCQVASGGCNTPFIDSASNNVSPYQHGLQYSGRGDQYFRQGKDRVYGYYYNIKLDSQRIDPRASANHLDTNRSWFTNANYTHVFTPNFLNEVQFAAYKVEGAAIPADPSVPLIHINNAESVTGFGGGWGPGSFIQHNYSWRDVATYVRGKHDFKFGIQAEHGDDSANFGGAQARPNFGFNSLTDFIQDKVYDEGNLSFDPFTGKFKPLQFGVQGTSFGLYAEDQWKIASNLSLTLGLRWDDFGNPSTYGYSTYTKIANVQLAGTSSQPNGANLDAQFTDASIKQSTNVYPSRQNLNFTPRAAFAWRPYKSNNNISLHGGVGLYRDPVTLGQVVDGLRGNPPGWVFPYFSPTQPLQAVYTLGTSQTLPYGYNYPTIPTAGLDARGGVIGAGAGVTGIDPNVRVPKTLNYTFGISTELRNHMVIGINGVGSHAYDQLSGTDFNRVAGDLIRNNGKLLRLNPSFSGIAYVSNLNTSNYYGLVTTLTQRVGNLNYQASYTFSKSTDFGTCNTRFDFNGGVDCPSDQHNFAANFGPSAFDVRNNFKISGSYTVPAPHIEAIVDHVLGGWEVATIATAQTGIPFSAVNFNNFDASCTGTIVTCGDYNADGYNNDRPNLAVGAPRGGFTRDDYKRGVFASASVTQNEKSYVVPTGFTAPAPGTLGNEPRNIFRNPGVLAMDASVIKNNSIRWFGSEKANLQVRMDFFNVLNRVNLRSVDYNVGSNTFGKSLDTLQPRIMQAGARFQF